jgi:dTDP-4-dehydrorhamnose 3,5-epimerase
MILKKTPLQDLYLVEPRIFEDARGYFFESYNYANFKKSGNPFRFVQDNQSKSDFGVIRGLHYQLNPKAQTKLVRVLSGRIFDVAVDVRKGSPTYGKWYGIELSEDNYIQLLIPKGFAHGFSVLSETAIIFYKCDEFYAPEFDSGVIYNDPSLSIDWKVPDNKVMVSEKDRMLPAFENAKNNFLF